MSRAIQRCVKCGRLEDGHTGPGDRYVCITCHRDGWRVDGAGNLTAPIRFMSGVGFPGGAGYVARTSDQMGGEAW